MVCFAHFDFGVCSAPQRRALFPHLNFQQCSENGVLCTFWLRNLLRARTACTFSTPQLPTVLREWCALYILTSKSASRQNGVRFFNLPTSKSAPKRRCFLHFDFEMSSCDNAVHFFHISTSIQKCSDVEVFFARGLRNFLRATAACNFSSHLTRWLRTRHPRLQGDGCWNSMKLHFCSRSTYLLPIVCTPRPMASPPRQLPPSLAANWSTLKNWYQWCMVWHQWSATSKKNR